MNLNYNLSETKERKKKKMKTNELSLILHQILSNFQIKKVQEKKIIFLQTVRKVMMKLKMKLKMKR